MPKIVSRSAVSSSTEAKPTASSTANLRVYYCICGEFILVIDKSLSNLPRRKTDNSTVIRAKDSPKGKARIFKINANLADPIILEREEGYEKQYHFQCTRCALPVGYQTVPPPAKSGDFVYILPGALTMEQGTIPKDAFDVGLDEDTEGNKNPDPSS